ncbi:MAG: adenylosuccinate lyase, partial [Bacilli bacterium]
DQLTVFPKQMIKNIWLTKGLVFSGQVGTSLIKKGLTREESYDMVQHAAFISNDEDVDFKEVLKQSKVSKYLTTLEIEDCFCIDAALRNVEKIYRRVFEHDE